MEKSFKNQLWRVSVSVTALTLVIYSVIFIAIGYIPEINQNAMHLESTGISFGLKTLFSWQIPLSRAWDIPLVCLLNLGVLFADKWYKSCQDSIYHHSESDVIVWLFSIIALICGIIIGLLSTLISGLIVCYAILIIGGMFTGTTDTMEDMHDSHTAAMRRPAWFRIIDGLYLGVVAGAAIAVIVGFWIGMIPGIWLGIVTILVVCIGTLLGIILKIMQKELIPWLNGK